MKGISSWGIAVVLASAMTGMGASAPDQTLSEASSSEPSVATPALPGGIATNQKYGWVLEASKWERLPIFVCWEDFRPEDAHARDVTRKAVAATWEANSGVKFTGWNRCFPGEEGIHIRVMDATAETKALGRYLNSRPRGMTLNFTLVKWKPACAPKGDTCLAAIAVHEFGHALGFSHEQNRLDAPDWCKEQKQGADGDFMLTEYDSRSIMNYCNANWAGTGGLSDRDIAAVQKFYGKG